jgi:hypothetical protein
MSQSRKGRDKQVASSLVEDEIANLSLGAVLLGKGSAWGAALTPSRKPWGAVLGWLREEQIPRAISSAFCTYAH